MEKFSNRKEAISLIKIRDCGGPLLWLVKEQLDFAEAEILSCNPQDPSMRDKLVKAQALRQLITTFNQDFK